MLDGFGRKISYLRLSVTDRCHLNCRYCVPSGKRKYIDDEKILAYDEIGRIVNLFRKLGIGKIRLTGGDPLVRSGIFDFLETIDRSDVYLTTKLAHPDLDIEKLNVLNLAGINLSCDSLKPDRYASITGGGDMNVFLKNVERLKNRNIKLNVVAMKGFNDGEILDFISFGKERSITVRFIEKMDIIKDSLLSFPLEEMKKNLVERKIISASGRRCSGSPAVYHSISNGTGRVGFIAPDSEPFCTSCNRIRIKADGGMKLCFYGASYSIREMLKHDDSRAMDCIRKLVFFKPESSARIEEKEPLYAFGG